MTIKNNSSAKGWIICLLAAIFFCYEYILRMEPSVMVTELMHEFQINATQFGMLSAFFYFTYTPMQIAVGVLSDLYGPRKILTLAVITCTIGSYIFGIAPSLTVAAIGRLLIGFGGAFAFICVLKLTASWLPPRFFAFFVGLATTLGMLGGMTGDIILSPLVQIIGWKQTINVGTIAGLILTPIIWLIIRDQPPNKTHKIKPLYRETFLGLVKILKNPQMWINGFIGCFMYLSLSVFAELWGIPFLTTVHHLSKHSAGIACSMVFLGWLVGGPIVGYISDMTYSRRIPILVGLFFAAISISLAIYLPQINLGLLHLLLFLFGLFSSCEVLCFAVSSENNPKHLVATASAFTNSLVMFSGIIFQPLVGKILDIFWSGQTLNSNRVYSVTDYQLALTILPLTLLLGFVLAFLLRETSEKNN